MSKGNEEYELIEFFGVLPEKKDEYTSFKIDKDGLKLVVTFFNYAFDVYIDLFRDNIEKPVFQTVIKNCAGMQFIKYPNGWECLEIAGPHYNVTLEEQWIVPIGTRIQINPHINVEMFQSSGN